MNPLGAKAPPLSFDDFFDLWHAPWWEEPRWIVVICLLCICLLGLAILAVRKLRRKKPSLIAGELAYWSRVAELEPKLFYEQLTVTLKKVLNAEALTEQELHSFIAQSALSSQEALMLQELFGRAAKIKYAEGPVVEAQMADDKARMIAFLQGAVERQKNARGSGSY